MPSSAVAPPGDIGGCYSTLLRPLPSPGLRRSHLRSLARPVLKRSARRRGAETNGTSWLGGARRARKCGAGTLNPNDGGARGSERRGGRQPAATQAIPYHQAPQTPSTATLTRRRSKSQRPRAPLQAARGSTLSNAATAAASVATTVAVQVAETWPAPGHPGDGGRISARRSRRSTGRTAAMLQTRGSQSALCRRPAHTE